MRLYEKIHRLSQLKVTEQGGKVQVFANMLYPERFPVVFRRGER